jgi:hypothetical protein
MNFTLIFKGYPPKLYGTSPNFSSALRVEFIAIEISLCFEEAMHWS